MPTLNIGGRRVTVGDEFMKMSPDQQQATVEEIAGQLGAQAGGGAATDSPLAAQPPPSGSKAERFLQNVTPEGPISGLISLMRLSGQAAQGRAPGLLTEEGQTSAIPAAVQGAVMGPGMRGAGAVSDVALAIPGRGLWGAIKEVAAGVPKAAAEPVPSTPPAPRQLTYQPFTRTGLSEEAKSAARTVDEFERVLRRGEQIPETSGPTITPPVQPGQVPPPSQLLPAQIVREFGAVRRGVELSTAQQAKEAARLKAAQPYMNTIMNIVRRSPHVGNALDAALPEATLRSALADPGKAASIAAWSGVYERAAKAKFTPEAKASLGLATRNLNNNLGTDLTLGDILGVE